MSNLCNLLLIKIVHFLWKCDYAQRLWHKRQLLLCMSIKGEYYESFYSIIFFQFEIFIEFITFG